MNAQPRDAFTKHPATAPAGDASLKNCAIWRKPPVLWVMLFTLLLVVGSVLPAVKLYSSPAQYLPWHTTLEFISMAVSAMVFALAWNLRRQLDNSHLILLGTGLLAVAMIDMAHTLSYNGMPPLVTPSSPEKAINFWLAGRYVAALVFLAVAMIPLRTWSLAVCKLALAAAMGLAAMVWWVALHHADLLPRTFTSGQGLTDFKIDAEYLLVLMYGMAALLIYLKCRRSQDDDLLWLAAAAWIQGLAEMFFTLYADVTDVFNLLGHVYKMVAYLMVYRALFVARVRAPYQQLDYEHSLLRTLFATLPNPVWLKDPHGVYLACNSAFECLYGAKEAAIVGKTDYNFDDRELAELFHSHDHKARGADGLLMDEVQLKFACNGYVGQFEITYTPMYSSDGHLIGTLGLAHDITQRGLTEMELEKNRQHLEELVAERTADLKQERDKAEAAEHSLRVSEAAVRRKLASLFEPEGGLGDLALADILDVPELQAMMDEFYRLTHIGCGIIDMKGKVLVGNGWQDICTQFHRINPEACKNCTESDTILSDGVVTGTYKSYHCKNQMWELATPIVIGGEHVGNMFLGQFFFDDEAPDIAAFRQQAIRYGFDEQEYLAALNRVPRWSKETVDAAMMFYSKLAAAISRLSYSTVKLARALAERDRTAVALVEARDAAEAANRAKSAFLANMSHELRTPMNAIMGMTELALRRASDAKQADQLGKVKTASAHLLAIINDILDISKIEAGRMQLEHVDFRLAAALENLVSLIGHKATEKGIKLLVRLQEGLPMRRFNGDPTRLGQILLNLAGNALKFTEQGSISVRASVVEDNTHDVLMRWEVTDTGIGIDRETQARLFTAFEQADNSMTRKYGGTGLGLVISQRLVHLMGGEIGVESTPNQGSTFWFTVRLSKASEAPPPAPTLPQDSAETQIKTRYARTRVLLAEDEPANQEVSRSLLVDVGLLVDVAEDGQQALDYAKQNRYALILMDMQMPKLNGIEATQAIRADSLNQTTPILAMTANAFADDRQACLAAGMNDHIAKPVEPQVLYETLLKWLAGLRR